MKTNIERILTCCCFGLLLTTHSLLARTVEVVVTDRKGNPVPDIIVMAESATQQPLAAAGSRQTTFDMDQKGLMFDPYMLTIPKGASVNFLNSDTTAHHVYSFSKTKRFTLPLHKSRVLEPVIFNATGVVTLGCNIHDHMIGYIVVAETHIHARTNSRGTAEVPIDENIDNVNIRIWSPRIRDKPVTLVKNASTTAPVRFLLKKKLKAAYNPKPMEMSEWDNY